MWNAYPMPIRGGIRCFGGPWSSSPARFRFNPMRWSSIYWRIKMIVSFRHPSFGSSNKCVFYDFQWKNYIPVVDMALVVVNFALRIASHWVFVDFHWFVGASLHSCAAVNASGNSVATVVPESAVNCRRFVAASWAEIEPTSQWRSAVPCADWKFLFAKQSIHFIFHSFKVEKSN